MGGVEANGDGATRTSAAMGSSSWAWRRAWRARSIAWRTAGHIARRVAARLESSMPCMFDGPTAIGVDETSYRKGAHVHHRGRRPQAQTGRLGARRIRQGGARPVPPTAGRRAARLHTDRHRRRRQVDRRQREGAPAERRARPGLVPHRLLDERRARPGRETVVEPGPARQRQDGDRGDARRQIRRAQEPGGSHRTAGHGSQGPALPVMATQGTPRDAPAPAHRTSRGQAETMDLPGLPQPHPRDRRTMQEDPQTQGRHPPKPSDSATPTPGSRHSTTRSRSPSAWPTASDTSTTSSP